MERNVEGVNQQNVTGVHKLPCVVFTANNVSGEKKHLYITQDILIEYLSCGPPL